MLNLCHHDTVVDTLRNVFHANVVEIPESRIEPLVVVAASKDTTSFRGAILPLLTKPTTFTKPQILQSTMPSVSGTKTQEVNLSVGLEILGNFLKGFGVPSLDLSPSFSGATKISFSFDSVIWRGTIVAGLGIPSVVLWHGVFAQRISERHSYAFVYVDGKCLFSNSSSGHSHNG